MQQNVSNPQEVFKDILSKLLDDKLDKFEILKIAGKFSVNLYEEESFSKQKYILQKFVLEQLLKVETQSSNYFSRLLKETESQLNLSKPAGYLCCLVGCLFSAPHHRTYLLHLKSVHHNYEKLICNFMKKCKREFATLSLLLEHVRECHSLVPDAPPRQVLEDIPCKCDITSCNGKKFRNVELLMTHINVKHAKDERSCIFYECSTHFSSGSNSRNHFRLKHKIPNKIKLKSKHLVNIIEDSGLVQDSFHETANEVSEEEGNDALYEENDISLFEVEGGNVATEVDEEDTNKKKFFQLQHADFLNRLSNFKFIPAKTVTQIADEYLKNSLKSKNVRELKLRMVLRDLNISEIQIEKIVHETITDDEYLQAQAELSTDFKRKKFIAENFKYIPPVEIVLNKDEVRNGEKPDGVHYISVIESFKHLIEDESLLEVLNQEREKSLKKTEILRDLRDGVAFHGNEYFQSNPGAFAAHFYSDAVEVSNPLGWAKGRHKIVQVFYTITQIPRCQRSQIDRMQLCMVFKEKHIKRYGYNAIYKKLIEDLKVLEVGIKVSFPVERVVQMGVFAYSADNLEAHGLGGFSCCFSSRDICRFCHCLHSELLDNIHDYDGDGMKEYWTSIEYDGICDDLETDNVVEEDPEDVFVTEENLFCEVEAEESDDSSDEYLNDEFYPESEEEEDEDDGSSLVKTRYGLRSRCPLNQLQSFHAVLGFPPDCMHDLLEGVVAQDLNAGIKILIKKGWFSLEEYNLKLKGLGYPSYESSDRPQEVPKKARKLSGKACSLWVHIRNFPLIVKNLVQDQNDEVFIFLLQLVDITARITAQEFRSYEIDVLEDKVIEFLDARKLIFSSFP